MHSLPHIPHLHVGIADLAPMRVAHKLCLFPATPKRPDKKIREAFRSLREWATGFGLDPDTLLHIGIPSLDGKTLVSMIVASNFLSQWMMQAMALT